MPAQHDNDRDRSLCWLAFQGSLNAKSRWPLQPCIQAGPLPFSACSFLILPGPVIHLAGVSKLLKNLRLLTPPVVRPDYRPETLL